MVCSKCGSENQSGKFCTKCGAPLAESEVAATTFAQQATTQAAPSANAEILEKGKHVSKQYFSYFVNALKHPASFSNQIDSRSMVNGIITIVLATLFLSLTVYSLAKEIADALMEAVGFFGIGDFDEPSFGSMFLKPFFLILIYFVFLNAVIFGALKLNKVQVSFQDVIARFGTYLVVPTVLFLFIYLSALLGLGVGFTAFIVSLAGASIYISIALTISSYKAAGKIDNYLVILLAFAVIVIVNSLILNAYVDKIVEALEAFGSFF
ncbi:zinc ribbon domain-containing protein [Caldibacillus lycopersici]|uniref:Zinc ribbon domain-containing protein n=1 Tax=Perspicuibacillus lycopersici TaxID=1325689 RepID=A0AAE3IU24_9BACI|nr:zinc ribbon domain-containing protein [Perspicuibacillus lycopersici]MCU9612809.1 zinc ribbon domain-containing protein [Perspicuibacillus lycopersici]